MRCVYGHRMQVQRKFTFYFFKYIIGVHDGLVQATAAVDWWDASCLAVVGRRSSNSLSSQQVPVKQLAHLHFLCKPLRPSTQSHPGSGCSETTSSSSRRLSYMRRANACAPLRCACGPARPERHGIARLCSSLLPELAFYLRHR